MSDHAPSVAAPGLRETLIAHLDEADKEFAYAATMDRPWRDRFGYVMAHYEGMAHGLRAALRAESVAAPLEIDAVIREQTRVAPEYDGAHREPNHYDWFMPENVEQHVDGYLDDLEAKLRQSLGDFYVHDMAMAVLPLIAAYREAKAARHAPPALDAARDLPDRVVVGKNGAYWRDYGTHYSMCPVSEDNDPVVPVAVYVRSSALDAARLTGALMEAFHDLLEGEDEEHRMDMSWWRNMARVVADAYGAATPASGEPAPGEEKE